MRICEFQENCRISAFRSMECQGIAKCTKPYELLCQIGVFGARNDFFHDIPFFATKHTLRRKTICAQKKFQRAPNRDSPPRAYAGMLISHYYLCFKKYSHWWDEHTPNDLGTRKFKDRNGDDFGENSEEFLKSSKSGRKGIRGW